MPTRMKLALALVFSAGRQLFSWVVTTEKISSTRLMRLRRVVMKPITILLMLASSFPLVPLPNALVTVWPL